MFFYSETPTKRPRKYNRGRKHYTDEELKDPIEAIRSGVLTYGEASKMFGIGRVTLYNKNISTANVDMSGGTPSFKMNASQNPISE